MKIVISLFLLFATFFSTVVAAPEKVLKPSEDPFYLPPSGYEDAKPGDILKFRRNPHRLRTVYAPLNIKNAYQYMYRTENALGKPSYAVSLLMEPYNANNSRLLQYSIAEDSASFDCGASYTFQYGASQSTLAGQAEGLLIQAPLNEGYWVNTADYEGPEATFTAGRMAGHAVLDAIRGALKTGNTTNIDPNADVLLWGYSGGALASGWAASLQPTYAPELSKNFIGCAIGGLPANITYTILAVDGTVYAGFLPDGIFGLSREYPGLLPVISKYFPKSFNYLATKVQASCLVPTIAYMAYSQIFQGPYRVVSDGLLVIRAPAVRAILRNTTLGVDPTEVPKCPVFIYHGIKDGIVPVNSTMDVYEAWCPNNLIDSLEVTLSKTTKHITEAVFGAPAAFTWIKDRFEHKNTTVKGCSMTTRESTLLYPGIARNTLELFEGITKTLFGFKVGVSSSSSTSKNKRNLGLDFDIDEYVENKIREENEQKYGGGFWRKK